MTYTKICEIADVRGGFEGPLELNSKDGRLVLIGYNQGGHDCVEIDLLDLADSIQAGALSQHLSTTDAHG